MVFKSLFLFLLCIPSSFGTELEPQEFYDMLREKGELSTYYYPTLSIVNQQCHTLNYSPLNDNVEQICKIAIESEVCEGLPAEDKLDCSDPNDSLSFNPIDFLSGCVEGLFDSVVEIIKFLWTIVKGTYNALANFGDTIDTAAQFLESAKLYLVNEYDLAYEEEESRFHTIRSARAMGVVAKNMAMKVYDAIQAIAYQQYQFLGCLNFRARTQRLCMLAGEFLIPPGAAVIKILGKGRKAVKLASRMTPDRPPRTPDLTPNNQLPGSATPPTSSVGLYRTNDTNVDFFRDAYHRGDFSGDAQYISYLDANGERIAGRVHGRNGGDLIVEIADGDFVNLSGTQLEFVKYSNTSRSHFSTRPPQPLRVEMEMSGADNVDEFRRAFNSDQFDDASRYISLEMGADRVAVKVVGRNRNSMVVEFPDGTTREVGEEIISTARISSTSRSAFGIQGRVTLPLSNDPNIDSFRKSFNQSSFQGDNRFISYDMGGQRVAVQVIRREGNDLIVENADGYRYALSRDDLQSARYSRTSRDGFVNQIQENGGVVRSEQPDFNLSLTQNSNEAVYDSFRQNFNRGVFNPEERYVSVPYGESRFAGEIQSVASDRIVVQVIDDHGIKRNVTVYGDDLDHVRTSSGSRASYQRDGDVFVELDQANIHGTHVGNFEMEGFAVDINPNSPALRRWVGESQRIIEQHTGIPPQLGRPLTASERQQIYNVWLEKIVPRIESREIQAGQKYGDARAVIANSNRGRADLGQVVEEGKAVCLELSMFGSTVLSQYGIRSRLRVGSTNMRSAQAGSGTHGRHAWLDVMDENGNWEGVLDSNNSRSFHNDYREYDDWLGGVSADMDIELMRPADG